MIHVRDACLDDADILVEGNARMAMETERLALDRTALSAGVRAALADPAKGSYFVAEWRASGRVTVAGQLLITYEWSDWRNGNIWWIQSVYVFPEFRRRGVFRALYAEVRRKAAAAGAVGLRLYVEKANATGQATYRSLGMSVTHYQIMEEMFQGVHDV